MDNIIIAQASPRPASQLVEIQIPVGAGQRVAFPDIQQLRSVGDLIIVLKAMRLIVADVLTHGVISGVANATLAELRKITLVLYCEGWEKAQYIPLLTLNDMQGTNTGAQGAHNFALTQFDDWQKVDWNKSYFQYANGQSPAGTPYCIMLDVQYLRVWTNGQPVVGAQ